MRKTLIFTTFLIAGLANLSPAKANPAAEQCLNQIRLSQEEGSPSDSAKLLASIEHDGSQYHLIREGYNLPGVPNARTYLRTNAQGDCQEVLSYLEGSYPSQKVYEDRLGTAVFNKLRQAARSQSGK